MKITWTNCADEMPPDSMQYVALRLKGTTSVERVCRGNQCQKLNRQSWQWAPYTTEKWKELNK